MLVHKPSIEIGVVGKIARDKVIVGWEWQGKRVKSISGQSLHFEVKGHEGVYFKIDRY